MAKNYTFSEAVEIIAKGTVMEAITDIGRRFPVLAHKVAVVAAKAGEAFVDLMGYMPDYLTANKVNTAIKSGITESGSNDDESEIDEATTETEEVVEGEAVDYESMSGKQLWDLLGKAGKRKLAKSTKKADLVEACKLAFGEDADEAETEDDAAEETTEANAYDGKSAMELFKECKKRGIKAAPKKPAKFYADLLVADDAKSGDTEEAEDDDWSEDETEAPKKEEKKLAKKADKKPAKKAKAEEEDEDDDWDI